MELAASGVLLDIEGTTSSVSFVYDVMFPFARRQLPIYLETKWRSPECQQACEQIARDAGHASLDAWAGKTAPPEERRELVQAEVIRLMDGDVKATGLKQLQGLIWEQGFATGELEAHVFDDVPTALLRWNAEGRDVRIYSSGSIHAQKLFFAHTDFGDLRSLFQGHYDTTTGPKREAESYRRIAAEFQLEPHEIVFFSDVPAELDAAKLAGMQTILTLRPGNADVRADQGHPAITSFLEVQFV